MMTIEFKISSALRRKLSFVLLIFFYSIGKTVAQDPVLPSANLGLTNSRDALSPPPGIFYNNYTQAYIPITSRGFSGQVVDGIPRVGYLLSLNQLVYLSKIRLFDGNFHFTALQPLVKLSAQGYSVNPGLRGDLTIGSGIQWRDKQLFRHSFWHRLEIDLNLPTGSYNTDFLINPSSHLYALSIYYTFTFFLSPHLSFGSRNQYNYNFNQLNSSIKPGDYYNGNYTLEYNPVGSFNFGIAGYYLRQFAQDSKDGNARYFQDQYAITDTREELFGFGPSVSFSTAGGIFIEGKVFFEVTGKNRSLGRSTTLRLAIPLKLQK